mmetsp:Transcript_68933/g.121866  ORF Transcript_68933/g.121866 Transcript_68933/m.121866 type:complete len:287 (+) Transcript_68933:13-873(+)
MAAGRNGAEPRSSSGRALSASQPTLPSVSSAQPLRRAASLTSAQKQSAAGLWQATLQKRLGTPGQPPPREHLPSLYDRGRGSNAAAARPVSGASRSAPPSTVGPSASVVAWFAQFQCTKCMKVPTALDAKFCFSCGEPLPLPKVPAAVFGGTKSRLAENLGEVAAAAALEAGWAQTAQTGGSRNGGQVAVDDRAAQEAAPAQPQPDVQTQPQQAQHAKGIEEIPSNQRRRGYRGGDVKPRPPRAPGHGGAPSAPGGDKKHLPWGTRESQVAVWLGNIKPRQHSMQI